MFENEENSKKQDKQKSRHFLRALKKLIKALGDFRLAVFAAILLASISSLLVVFAPRLIAQIVDVISLCVRENTAMDFAKIHPLALVALLIYLLSFCLDLGEELLLAKVSNQFAQKMRNQIVAKINRLPLRFFDKQKKGDIMSRVTNDVEQGAQGIEESMTTVIADCVLLIGVTIMMFLTNTIMAVVAIVASLCGVLLMALVIKKSQKYYQKTQYYTGQLNAHLEENYTNLLVVRAYNAEAKASEKFENLVQKLKSASTKSQFLGGLMFPVMHFMSSFGFVAVCVTGAILVSKGLIGFGVVAAFMIYVHNFMAPFTRMAQAMESIQLAVAACERVFDFLEQEEMPSETGLKNELDPQTLAGNIKFVNVHFSYDGVKPVIKNLNIDIKAGSKIAIVGPTGAGKTTLVNLLMKFYDLSEGDILIDGHSIHDYTRRAIRNLFTMVLQDSWLFYGTLRENLVYNRKGVSDRELKEVCKQVGLENLLAKMPKGLNSDLSEAESVSGGEKQLITIARSMLSVAPFLILDEATSNVDTRTEALVQKAMAKLTHGRTAFIIAHRLSTIRDADLILVMRKGNIVEMGKHKELLKQNGFYAKLYNAQFAN